MKLEEIKVLVMRVGGTNCDAETKRAFTELGVHAEIRHLNELVKNPNLLDYHALVFPGGFSYGDYVRSGAIFARMLTAKLGKELRSFLEDNRPILGICNGFQILVEEGLLPGFDAQSGVTQASLAANIPQGFKCEWVYLKNENHSKCVFTSKIPPKKVLRMPIAHGEGRFLFSKEKEQQLLQRLYDEDMVVLRYCNKDGSAANDKYPQNPNGSLNDIAGICNREGNIFGLMPHPERALYWWQQPDWTAQQNMSQYGDGKLIFESVLEYLLSKKL
ncbi:MAG: phosphoribosylformylglycinamidine synthase I [Candidatus Bathyarchaeota archaeon]|nr:phosphoribosylformylglycinamidine synthase I [Candidatus Bathyarchaeota archaeon]